ncbi:MULTISPECIES: type II secretion system F family protein [unclassified Bradyrhizobium]|uniref:type II secretion system F family protein n=1 Tax=unclassified Bradyrhizobium TaxID=2631580 RepID=UPI0024791770|nr:MULTISPECIES: type II secretion system F family protein [unclassified Bradyrhizobium]WGR74541.1 type II secretion system F family protein [Bradyrhizobium sp. ISRA426]WGR79376.1 type II secretion system F family protein [Bradyrhizobium sp. ISRA430]WGR89713.1 type II secretion system F family protein [Bradyrhizobium sp. ISRA432]
MPSFRYRALTQSGEIVVGSLVAPTRAEVERRISYLQLLPIEAVEEARSAPALRGGFGLNRPSRAEITTFTRDLALLLKAGARLDDALELLSSDSDVGRLRPVVGRLRMAVLGGESFADAVAAQPELFPSMYGALMRVGEASGTLDHVLEVLAGERERSEATRRKLADAMQYPTFVLLAAIGVMLFFILVVLPQFSSVLRDFGGRADTALGFFMDVSDVMRANGALISISCAVVLACGWWLLRQAKVRASLVAGLARLPGIGGIFIFYRTSLFCRNLGLLLGCGVNLTTTQRILVDVMSVTSSSAPWVEAADRVRQGGKLSQALAASNVLPPMAVRMLRLGEETGQLPALAGRIAEFYEAKLQRSLDRVLGIVGPVAILTISVVVGGLIVSVMTALLSVTQLVG